ncbi:uncharacterized protein LOC105186714 isoform X2 [Harpegnathos saltator]|uniref:uncharacterized protein LOC105186714 isoform X2 n=1 Tax=Harpegnathos saltator TaxID=610380 RepID=UPI000DBEEA26|nr:uncharacterized protein LOC105186714 isoform X2 [Harpegnathos saltator]
MALSRELLKRLNSEDEPLPKRLKLAETVFSTVDLPFIQKEEILLDWLCKICLTNQHAWKTLNNCLEFTHIDIKTNIKHCLVDMLIRALSDFTEGTYEEILKCCTLILANNSMQQYFTKKIEDLGLLELGDALSLLINKALCLSHNKNVIIILLTAVQSLSEVQSMLKYYMPKVTLTNTLSFPIQDDPWQQLIQRISNFGEDNCKNIMNKLIIHRIKLNLLDEPIKLHNLIGGLEYSWNTILKYDPNILSLLRDKEISKITHSLLIDMTSNEKNFHECLNILDKECIQENKCFLMHLLSHILIQIEQLFSSECSKSIIEHIHPKLLMEDKHNENEKFMKVLQIIKERILQQQWIPMTNEISCKIELYLEILLHIPILYFNPNTRTLIFLIVYSISKKCGMNKKMLTLCNSIFLDLLEKTGIDIFQHIEPTILVNELPQNKTFSKAFEFSLRNITTYSTLKNLIKSSTQSKEAMCIILERIEIIKPKLNLKQKIIFKKAETKLTKIILNMLSEEISDAFDVRCLTSALKVTILFKKNSLKELCISVAGSTLKNIFMTKKNLSDSTNGLLQEGMQLATVVLRYRKEFEIQDVIVENLWFVMLKYPNENLHKSLLASAQLKEFYTFIRLLHDETVKSLSQADETWTNLLIIWSDIIKTDMRMKRSKIYFDAINNLFGTVQLLQIPDRCWSDLVHLAHDIINAKHSVIPNDTFDFIMMISLKSLEKVKISSCENVLALCGILIKVRTNLIIDSLPTLLLLYRNVMNVIVHASKNISDKFKEHQFRCLALDIEKFIGLLVKLKKDMMRLSPYLIADILQLFIESTIPSYMKIALQNSLCHLIGICDQHGIALLSRTLPTSLQEVFKVQLNMFNKFYKYSGKI